MKLATKTRKISVSGSDSVSRKAVPFGQMTNAFNKPTLTLTLTLANDKHRIKRCLIGFLILVLPAPLLFPGTTPDTRRLESRLATAAGQERLEILKELTTAYMDKDPQKVQEYGREALGLAEKFPSPKDQVALLNLLSTASTLQGNFKQAQDYAVRSRTLAQQTGDSPGLADALDNLVQAYLYPRALDYYNRSLEIKEKFADQMGIAYTLVNIGSVYRKQGRYKEALQPLNRGLAIASAINTRAEIQQANKELSEVYTALHRYPLALQYLKKYKEIDSFIFNEVSSQKLTEMQTRYEMEKKQRDIDLLKKNNAIYQLTVNRQRNFNHFIIIAAGLLLIAGFMVYTRYRLKVKIARALTREIEEHRQTARKLKESEEKFKLLAESSVVGIYIIQDNVVKYVNPKFLSTWGCTLDEVLEQSPLTLVYEEDRPLVLEKMNRRLTGSDSTVRYEYRGVSRKNGEILYLESYGGMIHYQGKPAVLETVIDITSRKKTAEKLLKSQKLEAMGILVGGIAHDFNNFLGVLVGYLEMVKEEIQPGTPAQQLVENIENHYNRAVDLGQKLAAFAKTPWIAPQKLILPSILTGAIRDYPAMAALIAAVSIPEDLLYINGDERQLKQVFIHLFHYIHRVKRGEETAGDLIPGPGVSITAGSLYLPGENDYLLEGGEYVRIRVTDSGWSVPPNQVEKIFEPSFTAVSVPGSLKGAGLELALCHSIIKKHKGNISAASEPGKGTTFEIILPAYREQGSL